MSVPAVQNQTPSAPASSPGGSSMPKVLRIGLVLEGKIAQERLVRLGESVSIGTGSATFQVSDPTLGASWEVFAFNKSDRTYSLHVPESADGRMQWKGAIASLADIRNGGGATLKGDAWSYALDESVRGKITLGKATLLFQFVPAPPEPVHAMPESLQPGFFDRDDPLFMSLLGAFGAIGVAFMVFIASYDVPEAPQASVEDIVRLAVPRPIPRSVPKPQTAVVDVEEPKKDEKPKEEVTKPEPEQVTKPSAEAQPKPKPATRTEALAGTRLGALLKAVGTAGEGRAGAGQTSLNFGNVAARSAGGAGAAGGALLLPAGAGAPNGVVFGGGSVADVKSSGGGAVGAAVGSGGPTVAVRAPPKTTEQAPADSDPDNQTCIGKVRSYRNKISTCSSQAHSLNPKLAGSIKVKWDVTDGAVSGVSVLSNSTGDSGFAECVQRTIQTWKFPGMTCSVSGYTWNLVASE